MNFEEMEKELEAVGNRIGYLQNEIRTLIRRQTELEEILAPHWRSQADNWLARHDLSIGDKVWVDEEDLFITGVHEIVNADSKLNSIKLIEMNDFFLFRGIEEVVRFREIYLSREGKND